MQSSGVYNRYVNSDDDHNVASIDNIYNRMPGAPKKLKGEVKELAVKVDLQSQLLYLSTDCCPGAPKKVKQLRDVAIEVDLLPRRIDFTTGYCSRAPEQLQKTRFDFATPSRAAPVAVFTRMCPGAPKKDKKAMARTPLAWTAFTEADCMWTPNL